MHFSNDVVISGNNGISAETINDVIMRAIISILWEMLFKMVIAVMSVHNIHTSEDNSFEY